MKCTINLISKHNVYKLVTRSLELRNNEMNIIFLIDIMLLNNINKKLKDLIKKKYKMLSKVENNFLQYKLNSILSSNKNLSLVIKDINQEYFKMFFSGYTSFIPFLNSSGNHFLVNINNK